MLEKKQKSQGIKTKQLREYKINLRLNNRLTTLINNAVIDSYKTVYFVKKYYYSKNINFWNV